MVEKEIGIARGATMVKIVAEKIANSYWQELNQDNRISLAVRELTHTGEDRLKIINRNQVKSEKDQPL